MPHSPVAEGDQVGRMSEVNEPRSGRKSPSRYKGHVRRCGREMVSFLEVLDGMVKRGVDVRLIHAKDPGSNRRDDFDRYPTLWTDMERMLCPRMHFKCIFCTDPVA